MTQIEINRLSEQAEKVEKLRKKYPVSPPGHYKARTFTKEEKREMGQRAININGFPKREGALKNYEGLLPGEHIRIR